jgi:hypothetical protein
MVQKGSVWLRQLEACPILGLVAILDAGHLHKPPGAGELIIGNYM